MLERLQRAVAQAAEPLEAALQAGQAGQELDGRVQVRLRCVPSRRRPAGAGARLPRVIPLLVAAPPGEAERRRRGSPLGVRVVCCPLPLRGPRLFAREPRTPCPAARPVPLCGPVPLRAPRPEPRTLSLSARPVPLSHPFLRSPRPLRPERPRVPLALLLDTGAPAGRSRKVQRTRSGKVQPCRGRPARPALLGVRVPSLVRGRGHWVVGTRLSRACI